MNTLYFDLETFGITQKSLKLFRDEICKRIEHEIAIFCVPTADIVCGFLIVDKTTNDLTWTGDGFRSDEGGEGGAGYRTARELLRILGIQTFDLMLDDMPKPLVENGISNETELKKLVKYVMDTYKDEILYNKPASHNIRYIRLDK